MNRTTNRRAHGSPIVIRRGNDRKASGDCARAFVGRDGGALCFLGDVTGHDAKAAMLARELGTLVCEMAPWMAPGPLLCQLNSELAATWPPDLFVSAVCLWFDPDTQRGTIAVAGQMPPVIRSRGTTTVLDVTAGLPLGILAGERYREREFGLAAGELLVAVTDGITDPLASDGDPLGTAALARLIGRALPDANSICASLLGAAERSGLCDDATVLAVAPPLRGGASTFAPRRLDRLAA
jgi:serine phosphatase RsbU (regulator of sigma subunit)